MGKTKNKNLAQVFHYELYGKREEKYDFLNDNSILSIVWDELEYKKPYFFFVPKDFSAEEKYYEGFKLDSIYSRNNTGIQTKRDSLVYHFNTNSLKNTLADIQELEIEEFRRKYGLPADGRDWTIELARKDVLPQDGRIIKLSYHPFDTRFTYFTGRSKGFMAYPRCPLSLNCIKDNLSLLSIRNNRKGKTNNFFIANKVVDKDGVSPLDNCKFFPLYLYPESNGQQSIGQTEDRKPNLNAEIVKQFAKKLELDFTDEKENTENTFAPIDILDYIYAVLHSPNYREKYKEFLKIDFPRVPYPKDKYTFWQLVKLGGEIRQIHLLESPKVEEYITSYPIDGDNTITTKIGKKDWEITGIVQTHGRASHQVGRIWINEKQYFDKIPQVAWGFYIGGYQPAQKWLKDRKGRILSFEDILHYQKIIVALSETDRLMKEIDKIKIE